MSAGTSEGMSSNVAVVDWGEGMGSSKLGVGDGGCGIGTGVTWSV